MPYMLYPVSLVYEVFAVLIDRGACGVKQWKVATDCDIDRIMDHTWW